MATTIKIDPLTRIEGHLKIEVTVDLVDGVQQVIDAKSSGTMFRGFEKILVGHDPFDASHFTQRICGVCPISHGMASCLALEDAYNTVVTDNGRILRNLVLGANFIQSHVLHFYHLAALDYINTTGVLDIAPWSSRYVTDDMVTGELAQTLVDHYVQALEIRRKAHQMGAIFGGKLPASPSFSPGGCSEIASTEKITAFGLLLTEIRSFIDNVFVPDTLAVGELFPQYYSIGTGCGNLLAYGVFDLDAVGNNKLFSRGRYSDGVLNSVDISNITEDVSHSWYNNTSHLNPAVGETVPAPDKEGAYSWIKSPRYTNDVYELGPLARMWVNGDYDNGISVIDRLASRALEAQKIVNAMVNWLGELNTSQASYVSPLKLSGTSGIGLTEAPRGALGHWVDISDSKISRYQVITPTAWNASPVDDIGQKGPIEQALIGTDINDLTKPIEILRIVHSFDPCLACSVHMVRPTKNAKPTIIHIRPGAC